MIVAERGKRLFNADFSNIEGRINAWLAGEHWKLQAFRDFDAGVGPDLYKVTASRALDKLVEEILKEERQNMGKVPELACGFQGAVNAILKTAAKYGISMSREKAQQIVWGWREGNPAIEASWGIYQQAAIDAVDNPGCVISALGDKVAYLKPPGQDFLFCRLPSSRVISYARPLLGWSTKYFSPDGRMVPPDEVAEMTREERGDLEDRTSFGVTFLGAKNGRVRKIDLYGGMQCAHVVSGTARDMLVEAMFAVERERLPLALTIHDELLSEADKTRTALEYQQIIEASQPAYLRGAPIVCKATEGDRYDK
jgi:DNA polymerase